MKKPGKKGKERPASLAQKGRDWWILTDLDRDSGAALEVETSANKMASLGPQNPINAPV